MAIKTKAVGVRFPLELIERIERYQNEQGVNFTEALVKLVEMGLGGDEDGTIETSDDKLNERITISIKQLLDERITSIVNDKLNERIAEGVKQPLDIELDKHTDKNIPSDDSSNSEPIAEDVQLIPSDEIEQISGEIPQSLSFGDFHKLLGLSNTGNPSKAKGDIAIAIAKENGHGNWTMNSTTRKFTKQTEHN